MPVSHDTYTTARIPEFRNCLVALERDYAFTSILKQPDSTDSRLTTEIIPGSSKKKVQGQTPQSKKRNSFSLGALCLSRLLPAPVLVYTELHASSNGKLGRMEGSKLQSRERESSIRCTQRQIEREQDRKKKKNRGREEHAFHSVGVHFCWLPTLPEPATQDQREWRPSHGLQELAMH